MEAEHVIRARKLRVWVEGLSRDVMTTILIETIEELIMAETVNFYPDNRSPYWDANGERLDGIEEDA